MKLRIMVLEDADNDAEFTIPDRWYVHSVINSWDFQGRTFVKLLLEEHV